MANWCYNSVSLGEVSEENLIKFEKMVKEGPINSGHGYLFDIEFYRGDEFFSFTTKWGLEEGVVVFLVDLLEPSYLICSYEEAGMAFGGKYVYEDGVLEDQPISDLYWQTLGLYYESEDYFDSLDMDDFYNYNTAFSSMLDYYTDIIDEADFTSLIGKVQQIIYRNKDFKL